MPYKPPKAAQRNAQKVINWKDEHGDEVKGMTSVGWRRARQLASGKTISIETVRRMAQFNRHRENAKIDPKFKGTPWKDRGYVAWLGWGGTEGIDWAIRTSKKEQSKKMNNDKKVYITFEKMDEDQKMVFGYASTESIDSQGEIVERNAIQRALDDFMRFANMREMHQPSAVGKVKEAIVDDKGLFIGAKIVDSSAWEKVKEGVYNGFSIGGRIVEKVGNEIKELILEEISLVDRPANPDAVFSLVKLHNINENTMSKEELKKEEAVEAAEESKEEVTEEDVKEDTSVEVEEKKDVKEEEKADDADSTDEGTDEAVEEDVSEEGEEVTEEKEEEKEEDAEKAAMPEMKKFANLEADLTKAQETISNLVERVSTLEKSHAGKKARKSYATVEKSVAGSKAEPTAEEIKQDLRNKVALMTDAEVAKLNDAEKEKLFEAIS